MSDDFENLVKEAIERLPEKIRGKITNAVICVEDKPTREQLRKIRIKNPYRLFGLYEGVPKNQWGRGMGNILPDKITIFRKSIERAAKDDHEMKELIKNVVWHEVAHHFGFDEKKARELEDR